MIRESSFFGQHVEAVRRADSLTPECPVTLAKKVLERIGVTLPTGEFDTFVKDLGHKTSLSPQVTTQELSEISGGAEAMK